MAKNRTLFSCKISVLLIMIYDSLENYTQEWDDFQIGKEVQVEYLRKWHRKLIVRHFGKVNAKNPESNKVIGIVDQ